MLYKTSLKDALRAIQEILTFVHYTDLATLYTQEIGRTRTISVLENVAQLLHNVGYDHL